MKAPPFILVASLILNIGLATVLIGRSIKPAEPADTTTVAAANRSEKAEAPTPLTEATWSALSAGTEKDVLTRLHVEGFPPNIARALARTKLNERFAARLAALSAGQRVSPYWRYQPFGESTVAPRDPETRAKLRALNNEMAEASKALFENEETGPSDSLQTWRGRQYGNLPPEKIRQLEAINKDYGDLRAQASDDLRGIVFPEDQARLDLIERERRADIERTLSPEELEMYDLRSSSAAMQVRNQLSVFDPSEAEFRAIYKVQLEYDRRYKGQNLTADESREYRENMVAAVLSPERFAEYQITTAGAYQQLNALVTQFQLPRAAIGEVLVVQRDIARRAGAVRNDAALTSVERDAQLATLAGEATTKLMATLGADAFKDYRNMIGTWLQQLPPPAAKP